MTEITQIFNQTNVERMVNYSQTTIGKKELKGVKEHLSEMRKNFEEEGEMMETFANFANINTIEEMMELGKDGVRYGNCETAYENLYRLAKKCFKGNPKRDYFASSTLYYFWQNFAFEMGLMGVQTFKNGKETKKPIGSMEDFLKMAVGE